MSGEVHTYLSDFGNVPITKEQLDHCCTLSNDDRRAFDLRQMKHLSELWADGRPPGARPLMFTPVARRNAQGFSDIPPWQAVCGCEL